MRDCEEIAEVAHDKKATMSNLLRSLMTKEQRERFIQVAQDKRTNEQIACFLSKLLICAFAHKNK